MSIKKIGDQVKYKIYKKLSRNPDLITLRNDQYNRSRRRRVVKPLDIQTVTKVGGGSNPNFLFFK